MSIDPATPVDPEADHEGVSSPPDWDTTQPHPFHGPVDRLPRLRDGSVPAYYYLSPEEIVRIGIAPPTPVSDRLWGRGALGLEQQTRFIEVLSETGSVSGACAVAGISRMTAYRHRNRAEAHAFRAAWDAATRATVRILADTAMERAIEGVAEPVFYKGREVGTRRRYNDGLLMFLLRVRDPANYAPLAELGTWNQVRGIEPVPALDSALGRLEELAAGEPSARAALALRTDAPVTSVTGPAPAALPAPLPAALPAPLTAPTIVEQLSTRRLPDPLSFVELPEPVYVAPASEDRAAAAPRAGARKVRAPRRNGAG